MSLCSQTVENKTVKLKINPSKIILLSLFFFLFFALVPLSIATPQPPSRFEMGLPLIKQHLPDEYNAGSQTFAVITDSLGLVYVATNTGILVYDGSNYDLIRHPENYPVRSFVTDSNGRVYAGFRGDIGYLTPDLTGKLTYTSILPDSVLKAGIWDMWYAEAINDTVYFSSERNLYRYVPDFDGGKLKIWNMGEITNDYFMCIFKGFDRLMISRTHSGLQVLEGDSLVTIYSTPEIVGIKDGVQFDRDRTLVVRKYDGLFFWDGQNLTPFNSEISDELKDKKSAFMVKLAEKRYVISTLRNGLYIFNHKGEIERKLNKSIGLTSDRSRTMWIDKEGGLWIPTDYGFNRVNISTPIQVFDESLGLTGAIYDINRFDGALYAGGSDGLFRLEPGINPGIPAKFAQIGERSSVWNLLPFGDHLAALSVDSVSFLSVKDNKPWVWTDGPDFALTGAYFPDRNILVFGKFHNGLSLGKWTDNGPELLDISIPAESFLLNMIKENENELWFSADSKIIQRVNLDWNGNDLNSWEVTTYDTSNGLPLERYRSFVTNGIRHWGSKTGLFRYDKISDMFIPDSSLGIQFSGLSEGFEKPELTPEGNIWFNTTNGNGFRLVQDDSGNYEKEWPFQSIQPQQIEVFFSETSGITWVGSIGGMLYRYDQNSEHVDTSMFKALVRQVVIAEDSTLFKGIYPTSWSEPILTSSENSVRFRFSLPRHSNPELNEYQFRLIGLSDEWSEWSSETYHDFNSLRGGQYTFVVRGRDANGRISEIDQFSFSVLPPWYYTAWMIIIYIILGILLVLLIVKLTVRRIENERIRLEKLVDEKTKVAMEQFDRAKAAELKAKEKEITNNLAITIAHEFNNPLAIIKLCVDTEKLQADDQTIRADFHNKIYTQVERMANLVQKLVSLKEIRPVDYAAGLKILDIHNVKSSTDSDSSEV
jgi:Y_Y_Y domain/His Kinase A (phospho-acceptor) domain